MNKVRIGAIGVGGMASGHMRNLTGFDDVEFAAMCIRRLGHCWPRRRSSSA